jgi:hypothetical protein
MNNNEKQKPNNEKSTKNDQKQKINETSLQIEVKINNDSKQQIEKIDRKLDRLMYLFDDMSNMIDDLRGSFSVTEIIIILLLLIILVISFMDD